LEQFIIGCVHKTSELTHTTLQVQQPTTGRTHSPSEWSLSSYSHLVDIWADSDCICQPTLIL